MNSLEKQHYTVFIVGAGPIGLACALEASRKGLSCVVADKGTVVNSIYNYPVNMTFFSTSERLEIGGVPFVTNNPKPRRADALEYYRRVAQDARIPLKLFEAVVRIDKPECSAGPAFTITTTKAAYTADYVVLATGFYDIPYTLNIPGEGLEKVSHYYTDPHYYSFQKLVVVGAQNSAVDAALECWRKGADVTMVVRASEIGQRVKYWVKPDIENRITEGSIKAYFNSTVAEISAQSVRIQTPEGPVTLENDKVLLLTGYQPNLNFLLDVGVALSEATDRQPVYHPDTFETNVPGLYLAGVICGGMNTHRLFIENSRVHAVQIMAAIQRKRQGAGPSG